MLCWVEHENIYNLGDRQNETSKSQTVSFFSADGREAISERSVYSPGGRVNITYLPAR